MAGASLLTLIDDIATILDDVAVLTKLATRKTAGSTWTPSAMMPAQALRSSSTAPTAPGLRVWSGVIALNRCVTPVIPAANAALI